MDAGIKRQITCNYVKILIKKNGKFLDKEYKFLRVDRRGNISIISKGDSDELKFTSLQFKVI